ncbi:NADP-dependent oxidoreductase [Mycobacteroides chelonae]|jgi:NADPH:quinone reductase-like Zn-dependent oxidoreductase|uniref:Enoyl reductase (ER) domain-containing protein n=1 Tax=Mycobacteroides chelonae TaxID=1774 RepID=A0AB73M4M8_MYCCH|nr:NADP-dependent oxidoreductase [Mycobacteroides chelonae]MBF9326975.1 NADP-dependent oxidoreductase [Mycobacteroides chelonae]MBF9421152.1 NADP-dependent oxidoreductase [Mycobacteroides chelonae]MBF9436657.1 NADP-dependent oxidoreductase [Mycobacteroides chelonae]MBV6361054.1 NADP-dependent oxidoreductase [Mycobacteroides chelonae]MEC4833438.1 NADP-dependent oxidoreductase [Mycobacteroides chelonae]
MRAVGFETFGGPEVMKVLDLPEPRPGHGQVRIRVVAADINISDIGARNGANGYRPEWFPLHDGPYVVGWDAAGVIDEVGEGVDTFKPGDAVLALLHPKLTLGAQAEFVVADIASVVAAPRGKTLVEASTLLMNAVTARVLLDTLGLSRGDAIAVTGAAGAVGGYAVQLAKADGLHVIADASDADRDLVEALGADVVVERGKGFAQAVLDTYGPVAGALDSALLDDALVPAVSDDGIIASPRPSQSGGHPRGIKSTFEAVFDWLDATEKLAVVRDAVEAGALTLRVADVYLPDQAAEAHRRLEAGGVRGRLVITF